MTGQPVSAKATCSPRVMRRIAQMIVPVIVALLTSAVASSAASTSANIEAKHFSGDFAPEQVVAAAGAVWLVSSGPGGVDYGTGCRIGRLDPLTMALTTYPIRRCGMNVTAGDGAHFLETSTAEVKTESYEIHIERFSTSTHASTNFGAVSATLFLGSDIAHTQLAYLDGSLWLYAVAKGESSPQVLQLSPSTGAVERVYSDVPQIGGTEPIVLGTPGYLWLAGGAGAGADFARIDLHAATEESLRPPGRYASVYDMISVNRQIYFLYRASRSATSPASGLTDHIGHLGPDGVLEAHSPSEQVGSWLVNVSGRLFTVGPGTPCSSGLSLWRVEEQTLRTWVVPITNHRSTCLGGASYRPVAVAKDAAFVLYGAEAAPVLYRVTLQ